MQTVPPFKQYLKKPLKRKPPEILQLNIGLYCNQACSHCHVESSPLRTEMMSKQISERIMTIARNTPSIHTVDLTGGAPELNSEFQYLVTTATKYGYKVIDRCNLTVLEEPGQEHLGHFLAKHKVNVVASLPCYSEDNVDKQRGRGTFEKSIDGLKHLNSLGYGTDPDLVLDLVYNPNGAFLAPDQKKLEVAYKSELDKAYGIQFNRLLCLNNMPVKRFREYLERKDELEQYMHLLVDNFNPEATTGVMCTNLVSIKWDGSIYDCDFNQQLDMPISNKENKALTVFDVEDFNFENTPVKVEQHCFGCTAGCGSSCSGSTL